MTTPNQPEEPNSAHWGPWQAEPSGASPEAVTPTPGSQPYGQPNPYAQPAQPYGQPNPYAQPAQPYGQPGGYPVGGYLPPPKKSRVGLIIGIVAAVVLVVLGGVIAIGLAVNHHSKAAASKYSFDVPVQAGSYTKLTTAEATQVGDTLVSELQNASGVWSKPKVGVYGKTGSQTTGLILMALNVIDSPQLTVEMGTHSLDAEANTVLKGASLSNATAFPAGKFGGVLKCGALSAGTGSQTACIWLDHSTLGMVISGQGTTEDTAAVTLALREAGEH